jgi:trans-feruloyl-CoA hydratase/vanillin synthase
MSNKTYENIAIDKADGITWLRINRPEKRNAMSPGVHYDMEDALSHLATDAETKVLVLTGAGAAFCAGQDLKAYFRENDSNPIERRRAGLASHHWRWEMLSQFPKPTIAMVNGFCFGGAFTQLCACDFAIADEEATFGLSEVNWGIIPGGIVSWNVAQMLMPRHAMYYAATGKTFNGKRAEEIGLVNSAVPADRLRAEVIELAEGLMRLNPNVLRYTKEAVRAVSNMDVNTARDYLQVKQDSLAKNDKEIGGRVGMNKFLDDKSYRPGLGPYQR